MKWLITGGDGQLGQAMALELMEQGCDYISLNHKELDITNRSEILDCIKRESPTNVLNTAAWTNVDLAESQEELARDVNAIGPQLLAEECLRVGAKFVHISTDYVFSGALGPPWDEHEPQSPISAYGRTKAEGERLVLAAYPVGSYVVRTAWLYSPWGKNFLKTMTRIALEESRDVEVIMDQIGQPTSAIDLAAQIYRMTQQDIAPGIYHGTNSGQATWFEFAQLIFTLLGQNPARVIPISSKELTRPAARPIFSVLAHSHWSLAGISPMKDWKSALQETLPALLNTKEIGE